MPRTMTPKKSRRPQAFSQARNTGPREIITAISTTNSNATTQLSRRWSALRPGVVRPDLCASKIIKAADIDAAETTNSMPSRGVSDQIGRLVAARRPPEKPATKNPKSPPIKATIDPSAPGGLRLLAAGCCNCPSSASALRKARSENIPKMNSAQDPTDIGDQGLNKIW